MGIRRVVQLAVLLAAVTLSLQQLQGNDDAPGPCTKISASARLLTDFDWKYNCHLILPNIKALGADSVNIIITGYWIDLDGDNVVDSFCRKLGNHPCVPVTPEIQEVFIHHVSLCLQTADKLGFKKIELTPHLDDANQTARWRNRLLLDPLEKYGKPAMSYKEYMIDPLIESITRANLKANIYMSLQGEMNGALFFVPKRWIALGQAMKAALPAGSKIGLNNNYNTLCVINCNDVDAPSVNQLYSMVDYVGISAYRYVTENFVPEMLGGSAGEFSEGLLPLANMDLGAFMGLAGKELHYSEFGVGGGQLCGEVGTLDACIANGAADVAKFPYFGVGANYLPKFDPWQVDANRVFMQYFYTQAAAFAQTGGGWGWKVSQIFIWGYGSYDVVGVHPMSTTGFGTYKDPLVVKAVQDHNAQCK